MPAVCDHAKLPAVPSAWCPTRRAGHLSGEFGERPSPASLGFGT